MNLRNFLLIVVLTVCAPLVSSQRGDGQFFPCDPLVNTTCPPNPGLAQASYTMDFTKQSSLPCEWTIANYETVVYGPLGAEFTFAKRYDAPQIWSNFFILFGRVETVMRVAPGKGIISSSVLISDDFDEIDWEFSGNNFGATASRGKGQNNYFGKGITGIYDRGSFFNVTSPQTTFHTYTVDWSPTSIIWSVDGTPVRTLLAADCTDRTHQFPQSPSKVQLGLWGGGDASEGPGTANWAGGYTNLSLAPFTMYVKSVSITNLNPGTGYNYSDKTGSYQSIQVLHRNDYSGLCASSSTKKSAQPSYPISSSSKAEIRSSTLGSSSMLKPSTHSGTVASSISKAGSSTSRAGSQSTVISGTGSTVRSCTSSFASCSSSSKTEVQLSINSETSSGARPAISSSSSSSSKAPTRSSTTSTSVSPNAITAKSIASGTHSLTSDSQALTAMSAHSSNMKLSSAHLYSITTSAPATIVNDCKCPPGYDIMSSSTSSIKSSAMPRHRRGIRPTSDGGPQYHTQGRAHNLWHRKRYTFAQ